ncbi:MAG TPA: glutaredoxin 3 [Rhodospirillaceae bacterium]|nr:glutaredoxin 3 [Rhodospirillaceae bacterium]
MAKVEIYTKPGCSYCYRAKTLLERKAVVFTEIDISRSEDLRVAMVARSEGRQTVPQIFIDGRAIGGCDDMMDLDRRGALDPLLGVVA